MGISTNGNNYGKYTNSELDALMDKVANESDANTRWQEMKDAEKILLADYAYIPVFEKGAATLQNPKVKNLVTCRGSIYIPICIKIVDKINRNTIFRYCVSS